jgi:hypothetical protein
MAWPKSVAQDSYRESRTFGWFISTERGHGGNERASKGTGNGERFLQGTANMVRCGGVDRNMRCRVGCAHPVPGTSGPRSDCDVFGDMTLQWNSDVAPAKTALSTDPSQRDAVLIVAGAEESFSYALRASTRDLSSRSIQSALNRWADGLYRGTGRSVGVSPSASYATAPISHACRCVGTVCGTDKSSVDVQLAWSKGVDVQQHWVQHRSSNRPEKADIHDIDNGVSNIIMYAI